MNFRIGEAHARTGGVWDRDRDDVEARRLALAAEVMGYLQSHPNAADTPEGIARWWISRQRLTENVAAVRDSLALLVEAGRVRVELTRDGRQVYRAVNTQA